VHSGRPQLAENAPHRRRHASALGLFIRVEELLTILEGSDAIVELTDPKIDDAGVISQNASGDGVVVQAGRKYGVDRSRAAGSLLYPTPFPGV
ncbi:MAG: hypothetical protein ACREP7_05285, partial [Lysobacter sp.]